MSKIFRYWPKPSLLIPALVVGSFFAAVTSFGAVVFDTLGSETGGTTGAGFAGFSLSLAERFATDSTSTSISEVTLRLNNQASKSGNYAVSLFSDNGANGTSDRPFSLLGSIGTGSIGAIPITSTDITFSGLSLAVVPSTRYWVVLTPDAGKYIYWDTTSLSLPAQAAMSYRDSSGWYDTSEGGAFQMSVTAVPEPGESALAVALGLLGFIQWHRGNKQKRAA